jgi:hypothetical protein
MEIIPSLRALALSFVITGLDPAIHVFVSNKMKVKCGSPGQAR